MDNDNRFCICGHSVYDHHRSWFPGKDGYYEVLEECEYEGYNETGGMLYVDGKWEEHCQRFRLDGQYQETT